MLQFTILKYKPYRKTTASKRNLLLMWRIYHYLQGLYTSQVVNRISSINSSSSPPFFLATRHGVTVPAPEHAAVLPLRVGPVQVVRFWGNKVSPYHLLSLFFQMDFYGPPYKWPGFTVSLGLFYFTLLKKGAQKTP